MKLYLTIIAVAICLCAALNIAFAPAVGLTVPYALGKAGLCVAFVFAVDAIVALIVHNLPGKWFAPEKKIFTVSKRERRFYEKIGVRNWKDRIPETGGLLCHFAKDKIAEMNNPEYMYKFLIETGYAEVMHVLSVPLSFLTLLLCPLRVCWLSALPVALVNVCLQIPPAFVQRYNRPRLLAAYKRASRSFARAAEEKDAAAEAATAEIPTDPEADRTENGEKSFVGA